MPSTSLRLEKLKALLMESPLDAFLLFAVAKEYETLNCEKDSLYYYEQLFENHPDYVGLYYHWGKLMEKLDNSIRAIEIYEHGIKIAVKQGDKHAENELKSAKLNCELLL